MFIFYILDSALSLDETAEEILDEDAVLGVSNICVCVCICVCIIKIYIIF